MNKLTARQSLASTLRRNAEAKPLVVVAASSGIIARHAEVSQADLIVASSTGRGGRPGLAAGAGGDANATTLELAEEILNVTRRTPVVGGLDAGDPRYLDTDKLLHRFAGAGFEGIVNLPSAGSFPVQANERSHLSQGVAREVHVLERAAHLGLFTMANVYSDDQVRTMAAANVNVLVLNTLHPRSILDAKAATETDQERLARLAALARAALRMNPEILLLINYDHIDDVDLQRDVLSQVCAHGFFVAEALQWREVARAVTGTVRRFKAVPHDRLRK